MRNIGLSAGSIGDRSPPEPGNLLGLRLFGRRLAAFGIVQVGALVEHHQERRQALGLHESEDLDVLAGPLAPAGEFDIAIQPRLALCAKLSHMHICS